jgi:hypothetical protein
MRRGDCCTLLRSSVDLKGGFVTVKTAKTASRCKIETKSLSSNEALVASAETLAKLAETMQHLMTELELQIRCEVTSQPNDIALLMHGVPSAMGIRSSSEPKT